MNRRLFLAILGFFIAHELLVSACQNLSDFCLDDTYNPENQDSRGGNKYEFIASKLGIIGQDSLTLPEALGKLFKACASPGMVAAYFGAVVIGKNYYDWEVFEQLIYGITIATSTQLVCTGIGEYLDNAAQKKVEKFNKFIAAWPSYKTGTPEEFHQMFDGLHMLYSNNGKSLDVSQDFVQAVVKRVILAYVESLATKEPAY